MFDLRTLRDPDAYLYEGQTRFIRCVKADYAQFLIPFLENGISGPLSDSVIRSKLVLAPNELEGRVQASEKEKYVYLEHPKIFFPSYSYEWSPEMLAQAGDLMLDLARKALLSGAGLKDATPNNILFDGTKPVFIDVASFEPRVSENALWLAAAQFKRTFLYPLMLAQDFGIPLRDSCLCRLDGVEAEEIFQIASWARRFSPFYLRHVSFAVWARRKATKESQLYHGLEFSNPEKASFILNRLFSSLQRALKKTMESTRTSHWSDYMDKNLIYSDEEFLKKKSSVSNILCDLAPSTILDVGCNTGHFSALAAQYGAKVIAIDNDETSISHLWKRAQGEGLDILPLVVDLVLPSPGSGWGNRERYSFLERSAKKFDVVLMLAVVHHLLVNGGIPLAELFKTVRSMAKTAVIIEYVSPEDPMFQKIMRGRSSMFQDLTKEEFRKALRNEFPVVAEIASMMDGRRVLYMAGLER